jgi:hypothetical protein
VRKIGAFAAAAAGLVATLLACASKVATKTPFRFTALDPTLRVDDLYGDQLEELAVDGATFQQSCYDDALRRYCLGPAFLAASQGGLAGCTTTFPVCISSPPDLDGGAFVALTRGATPSATIQCAVSVGELSACIVDQQRELHDWLRDPCDELTTHQWAPATAPSCSEVLSKRGCAVLIAQLVPDLCDPAGTCVY